MTEKYLPVPVWNRTAHRWEPIDFRAGQRIVDWPERKLQGVRMLKGGTFRASLAFLSRRNAIVEK